MAATESVIASANSEPSDRLTTATQPHAVPSPTVEASPTVPSHEPAAASARYTGTPITRPQSSETSSTPGIAITLSNATKRAGAALGPAALDQRVGEPRVEAEEAERLEAEHESRRPGEAAAPRQVVDGLDRKGMSE